MTYFLYRCKDNANSQEMQGLGREMSNYQNVRLSFRSKKWRLKAEFGSAEKGHFVVLVKIGFWLPA